MTVHGTIHDIVSHVWAGAVLQASKRYGTIDWHIVACLRLKTNVQHYEGTFNQMRQELFSGLKLKKSGQPF